MTDTGRRVALLREAKVSLLKAREDARDRLCVGAKYPGKPAEYKYVVSESCANIQKTKQDRLDKKNKIFKAKPGQSVSMAQNRRELVQVTHVLDTQYDGEPTGAVHNFLLLKFFGYMARPFYRLKYPDPEARFKAMLVQLKKVQKAAKNNEKLNIPRHHVFAMYEVHLQSLIRLD